MGCAKSVDEIKENTISGCIQFIRNNCTNAVSKIEEIGIEGNMVRCLYNYGVGDVTLTLNMSDFTETVTESSNLKALKYYDESLMAVPYENAGMLIRVIFKEDEEGYQWEDEVSLISGISYSFDDYSIAYFSGYLNDNDSYCYITSMNYESAYEQKGLNIWFSGNIVEYKDLIECIEFSICRQEDVYSKFYNPMIIPHTNGTIGVYNEVNLLDYDEKSFRDITSVEYDGAQFGKFYAYLRSSLVAKPFTFILSPMTSDGKYPKTYLFDEYCDTKDITINEVTWTGYYVDDEPILLYRDIETGATAGHEIEVMVNQSIKSTSTWFVFVLLGGEQSDNSNLKYPCTAQKVVLNSSTAGSTKKFEVTVNDEGVLTAVEIGATSE